MVGFIDNGGANSYFCIWRSHIKILCFPISYVYFTFPQFLTHRFCKEEETERVFDFWELFYWKPDLSSYFRYHLDKSFYRTWMLCVKRSSWNTLLFSGFSYRKSNISIDLQYCISWSLFHTTGLSTKCYRLRNWFPTLDDHCLVDCFEHFLIAVCYMVDTYFTEFLNAIQ